MDTTTESPESSIDMLMPDLRAVYKKTVSLRQALAGLDERKLLQRLLSWNRQENVEKGNWKQSAFAHKEELQMNFGALVEIIQKKNSEEFLQLLVAMDNNALKALNFLDWESKPKSAAA